jgi:hypothetical protein
LQPVAILSLNGVIMSSRERWYENFWPWHGSNEGRQKDPALVAHYWTGGAPAGHKVREIGLTGLSLETKDRWYPGTEFRITLQRTDKPEPIAENSIVVQTQVVGVTSDGVELEFVPGVAHTAQPNPAVVTHSRHVLLDGVADERSLKKFLERLKKDG